MCIANDNVDETTKPRNSKQVSTFVMTNPVVVVASISEDMTYDKLDIMCEILMGYFRYSNFAE